MLFMSLKIPMFGEDQPMKMFVEPSHPRLSMPADVVPVEEIRSEYIQKLIDEMISIAGGERGDVEKRVMVGLAAPQIGVYKQVILVDMAISAERKELGKLKAYINPKIIWKSEEKDFEREGCYSVDSRISGVVPRATKIKISAYDREGNPITEELSGFTARIFQHEVDHLEGIRFPDRVAEGQGGNLHWVEENEFPEYRKIWREWPKSVPLDTWHAMKKGSG